jgi:Cu-Zn family superoxide dismutase
MIRAAAPLLAAALLAGCQTTANGPAAPLGHAVLYFSDGRPAGTAQLVAAGDTVSVVATLSGFPQGTHAVHLHTTGKCEAPGFTSAGGHLNPAMHQHGKDNPNGMHLGDLPNAEIAANGGGSISFELMGAKDTVLGEIYDADGTAIVVHEKADDYRTDPTGNAGSRLACGVFEAH